MTPADMTQRPLARLEVMRRRARRTLRCEELWKAVRIPCLLLAVWLLGSLVHLPQLLPDGLRLTLEVAFLLYSLVSIRRHLRALPPITPVQIDARIEQDSRLPFHPLTTLGDHPAPIGDNGAHTTQNRLWERHREWVIRSLTALRVAPPRLFPTRRAKISVSVLTLLGLGALIQAGPHILPRLQSALVPWMDDDSSPMPHLQAWIDRPAYAPGAPIFLSLGQGDPIAIGPLPEGSTLHLLMTDSRGRPFLSGVRHMQRHRLSATSWQADATLTRSGTVRLRSRGRVLATWPFTILADTPPTIVWTGTPGPEKNSWRTRFPWKAEQGFGLASVGVEINARGTHLYVPLPLKPHATKAEATTTLDLSDTPLAGLVVQGRLKAQGLSGKTTFSKSLSFHLATRSFHDPVARALLTLRQHIALGESTLDETKCDLALLTELPLSTDIRAPLAIINTYLHKEAPLSSLISAEQAAMLEEQLWFLALYAEDLSQNGPVMAASMAELRAARQDVAQQVRNMGPHHPPSPTEQEELHTRLERLKKALDQRMTLMFHKASQSGIVMPLPGGKPAPWNTLAETIEHDASQNRTDRALEHLQQMADMAEQMRQADGTDLQALAGQMKAQAESRAQQRALRDLIKMETKLLNHSQARFAAARKAATDAEGPHDIGEMSTADLLRQLGMTPPPDADAPEAPLTTPAIDDLTVLDQADARQDDHMHQQALKALGQILLHRGQDLTDRTIPGLEKADHDMQDALHGLAQRHDHDAAVAEQKVLADLAAAQKEMRDNQRSSRNSKQGKLGFIPPPGSGHGSHQSRQGRQAPDSNQGDSQKSDGSGQDPDDDDLDDMQQEDDEENGDSSQQKNQDPLGRKMDTGPESDAHIPDQKAHDQARAIEKELRRRASDQTRPQHELDYLNRLLAPFRNGTLSGH